MRSANAGSASPTESYLRDWHHRHPDACRVFVNARDDAGRSSYQRLASLAQHATAVLDVACGTGALLSLVRGVAPAARLAGVDLSESELRLAAQRLPDSQLSVARAQALPLTRGSVDLVLCHMALMLMDRPEDAILEIRRVLRAGGLFSAVTNRPAAPDPMAKVILDALRPARRRVHASMKPPQLGDPRTYEPDTLLALASAHFTAVEVEQFVVVEHVPRRALWPYLVDSLYGLDAIADDDARAVLVELNLPDLVPSALPMIQINGRA
jgi:ubiquinone/menaquinone biosynthesis C-methylase UbiE